MYSLNSLANISTSNPGSMILINLVTFAVSFSSASRPNQPVTDRTLEMKGSSDSSYRSRMSASFWKTGEVVL